VIKSDIILFENWFSEVTFLQENLRFLFNFMIKFQNEAFSWKFCLEIVETQQFSLLLVLVVVVIVSCVIPSPPNFRQLPSSIPALQQKAELFRRTAVEMNHFRSQLDSLVLLPFPPFRKTGERY